MKESKSLKQIKKLIKSTQAKLEAGIRKQLTQYDKIKDEKERKKAKQTFLLTYQAVFNDSCRAVLREFCFNKRLEAMMKKSKKTIARLSDETNISVTMLTAAIEGTIEVKDEWQCKIAQVLNCKVDEIFD